MSRNILITFLCLALASLGISGAHRHVTGSAPEDMRAGYLVTLIDFDHHDAHQGEGDIDVDSAAHTFGKLPLVKAFIATAVSYIVVWLVARAWSLLQVRTGPLRPPKLRLRYSLLPPSHAPPCTAS